MSVRKLRLLSSVLALCLLLTGVSGCGENKKKHFVMRTFSTFGSDSDVKAYSDIVAEFSKEHRHITINDTSTTPSGSYKMELSIPSTYRGASTPDVIYYSAIPDMSELSDFFMTIDDIRKEYPNFAKNVSDAAINSVAAQDGSRFCIPIRGQWSGIIINAALFRRSGLKIPETWDDIIRAARHFEKGKVSLFANSLEDSGALVEYMIRGLGGVDSLQSAMNGSPDANLGKVLDAINDLDSLNAFPDMTKGSFDYLVSSSDLMHTKDKRALSPIEMYNSGKAAILLMDNSMCGEINTDIDSVYIALPQVGTQNQTGFTTEPFSYPTHALSGPVYPPITANTLPHDDETEASGQRSPTPDSTDATDATAGSNASDDNTQEKENGLYVNFAEGFYITKKAYYDMNKRDDVIQFVETFLKEENLVRLCGNYQTPSLTKLTDKVKDGLTEKSNIYNGVIKSVQTSDSFLITTQTQENSFFWEHCSMAVSCMSKGIIDRNEALSMISDTQLTVTDIYSNRRKGTA